MSPELHGLGGLLCFAAHCDVVHLCRTSCPLNNCSCLYSWSTLPLNPCCGVSVFPAQAGGCGAGSAVLSRSLLMSCVFSQPLRWLSTLWPNFWEMLPTCAIPCGTRLFLLNGCFFSLSFPAVVFLLVSDFRFHYVVSASQADSTFSSFFFSCFSAAQGWILSHLLKLIFLRFLFSLKGWITSCLFQFAFLLPLTPYQSGIKTHQCITSSSFLGPFQIFLFLLWSLLSVLSILQALWYSSISSSQFVLNPPGFMALLTPGPIFKSDIGERLWKASGSFCWFIFALNSMGKKNLLIKEDIVLFAIFM